MEQLDLLLLHTVATDDFGNAREFGAGELADVLDGIRARRNDSVHRRQRLWPGRRPGCDSLGPVRLFADRLEYCGPAHMQTEVIRLAAEQNIGLMVRSVLMRGALTHRYEFLPESLAPVRNAVLQLMTLARGAGISLPELAYRYVLSQPGPISALVGTGRMAELEQCVQSAGLGPLDDSLLHAVRRIHIGDERLLDLSRWPSF